MRDYWENMYVTSENIYVDNNEVIFVAEYKEGMKRETSIWSLDYQKEKIREIRSGLKYVSDIVKDTYSNLIIVRVKEGKNEYGLYAFDYAGKEVWKYSFQKNVTRVIVEETGNILVSVLENRKGSIYCLSSKGKLVWKKYLNDIITMTQTAGKGMFYFYMNKNIYIIDKEGNELGYLDVKEESFITEIALWNEYIVVVGIENLRCYTEDGKLVWSIKYQDARIQRKILFDEKGNVYFITTKSELISLDINGNFRWRKKTQYYVDSYRLDIVDNKIIVTSEKMGKHSVTEIFSTEGQRLRAIEREESVAWVKILNNKYVSFSYDYEYMKGIYINVSQQDKAELEDKQSLHTVKERINNDNPAKWKLDWAEWIFEYIKMALDLYLEEYVKFNTVKVVFSMENSPKISFKIKDSWINIDFLGMKHKENDDRYKECYFRDETVWYDFIRCENPSSLDYIAGEISKRLEKEYNVEVLQEIKCRFI